MKIFTLLMLLLVLGGCATAPPPTKKYTFPNYEGADHATLVFEAPNLKVEKTLLGEFHQEVSARLYNECDKSNFGKLSGEVGKFLLSSDPSVGKDREIYVKSGEVIFIEFGIDHQYAKGAERFAFVPERNARYIFQFYLNGWRYHTRSGELVRDDSGKQVLKEIDFKYNSNSSIWEWGSWKKCEKS